MKRKLLIGLFTFGSLAGFGSGIASMAFWHGHHARARQLAWEAHVADVCVDAALRAQDDTAYDRPPPPERRHRHRPHRGHW